MMIVVMMMVLIDINNWSIYRGAMAIAVLLMLSTCHVIHLFPWDWVGIIWRLGTIRFLWDANDLFGIAFRTVFNERLIL